ncbi:MAG TPA: maleylpyruvate isomerase N-terminal domain-containing protein [Acidimicrobiales bacterium]|nr:maleylpyruvate isomerase N-terminal domain-containing protein [Acidimicrobiales bacterium]
MRHDARHWTEARTAIAHLAPKFVSVVRESTPVGAVLGHWGTGEIAAHVSHVIRLDGDALAGTPLPHAELRPDAVAEVTDAELAADPERDPEVLAERVEAQLAEFLGRTERPASESVTWLGGVQLPASAVMCHLLEELLVHGYDLATAGGRSWPIAPTHAALAIVGAGAPIVTAAGPTAFVNPRHASGFRARFDIRLRGQEGVTVDFDEGLTIRVGAEARNGKPFDAHISADPAAMLLLMLNRVKPGPLALRGKVFVWGRRPWRVPRMVAAMSPP